MSAMKSTYTLALEVVAAMDEYERFTAENTIDGISASREVDIKRCELWAKAYDLDIELIRSVGWEWRDRVISAAKANA